MLSNAIKFTKVGGVELTVRRHEFAQQSSTPIVGSPKKERLPLHIIVQVRSARADRHTPATGGIDGASERRASHRARSPIFSHLPALFVFLLRALFMAWQDSGIGISGAQLSTLFKSFRQ